MMYDVWCITGVVTMPYGVREGINVFLSGFVPTENLRFRQFALNFKVQHTTHIKHTHHTYTHTHKHTHTDKNVFNIWVYANIMTESLFFVSMLQIIHC